MLILSLHAWISVKREGQEAKGSSSLIPKNAEPILFVFLFVLLPPVGTGLWGDGDDTGEQGPILAIPYLEEGAMGLWK